MSTTQTRTNKSNGTTSSATARKVAKNRLGFVAKSKNGKSIILTVEQDMTLSAGTKVILQKPSEEVDSLVRNGLITEEEGETRKSKIPEFKLYNANVLPTQQD